MSKLILNEEYSISKIVFDAASSVLKTIENEIDKTNWFGNFKVVKLNFENNPLLNSVKNITIIIQNVHDISEIGANSNTNGMSINITLYCLNHEVSMLEIQKNLLHELEHVCQRLMITKNNNDFNMSSLYHIALKNINNNIEIVNIAAHLLYWLNQKEIDAFLHECYVEYAAFLKAEIEMSELNSIAENKIYNINLLYEKFINYRLNTNNRKALIHFLGRDFKTLKFYFNHGIKYLNHKLNRVKFKCEKDFNEKPLNGQIFNILKNNKQLKSI